ncbi:MAG: RND transporter, partial [Proteobacteria bacterium]|nr:RND transporter [Pseudomonadota bacterium]
MILHKIVKKSLRHPKTVLLIYAIITVIFLIQFPKIGIDTNPENMLYADEPARVAHKEFKEEFALHDAIMVGVVNDASAEGVFTPTTLNNIKAVTEEIAEIEGVIAYDLISITTTD